jgi:hypothetical protein
MSLTDTIKGIAGLDPTAHADADTKGRPGSTEKPPSEGH